MQHRGAALLSVLGLMLIMLPVGAYLVLQARTDFLIQRSFREEIEAFYVAEAGLEHAIAEIRPDQSFDNLLAGPDHVSGTADDGVFPFAAGTPAPFPIDPFRYEVSVSAAAPTALLVASRGYGRNGAARVVSAMLLRSPAPWTPAALLAEGNLESLDLGDGSILLSGFDHRVGDPPSAPTGSADPVAAAAGTAADAASMILQQLGAALAGRFVGLGGPPSITTAPQVDIQTLSSRVAQLAEAVLLGSIAASDHVSLGSRQMPQASVVTGDVDIGDQTSGSGILVILGGLHVSGTFNFTGLVVVMGGISFEPGSEVSVAGALWRGPGVDRRMRLRGAGALMYSSEALAEADAAFPGLLPHAVVMSGWMEQL